MSTKLNFECINQGVSVNMERVAILDADGQYCQIMDRCIRELGVESDILPFTMSAHNIRKWGYKAIIVLGRSDLMQIQNVPKYDPKLLNMGLPILGIDYGMQMLNREFGGKSLPEGLKEEGQFNVTVDTNCPLFKGLEQTQIVFLTRSDSVAKLPPSFSQCISSCFCTAICNDERRQYGLQFHPESEFTVNGKAMLKNFLCEVCEFSGSYSLQHQETETIEHITRKTKHNKVFILFTGEDVYNLTCTFLIRKVLSPERILPVYINTGLGRPDGAQKVSALLNTIGLDLQVLEVEEIFSRATTMMPLDPNEPDLGSRTTKQLNKTIGGEEKRKIISETLGGVLDRLGLKYDQFLLVQPTLRSDLFPSILRLVSNKTNCNFTSCELLWRLKKAGRIVEPLKKLYEHEVRGLARKVGLSREIIMGRPLPQTGFACRVHCTDLAYIGEDFLETYAVLRCLTDFDPTSTDHAGLMGYVNESIGDDERRKLVRISKEFQLTVTLLPIQCSGADGAAGYAVDVSSDREPDWDYLSFLCPLVLRICPNITRFCYIFGKSVKDMIPTVVPTHLTRDVLDKVARIDEAVMTVVSGSNSDDVIVCLPVVLLPLIFDCIQPLQTVPKEHSVVIRPTCTQDSMTLITALPGKHFPLHLSRQVVKKILDVPGVSRVLYDLTTLTESTVEWEQ